VEEFNRLSFLLLPRTQSKIVFSPHSRHFSSHRQGVQCRRRMVFWSKIWSFFRFSPPLTGMSPHFTPFCGRSCRFYCHRQRQRLLEWKGVLTKHLLHCSVVNFNFHGTVGMIYYIYDIKLLLSLWYPCNYQFNLLYDHLCTINCWPATKFWHTFIISDLWKRL